MKTKVIRKTGDLIPLPRIGEPFNFQDSNDVYIRISDIAHILYPLSNVNDSIYGVNLVTGEIVAFWGSSLEHIKVLRSTQNTLTFKEK